MLFLVAANTCVQTSRKKGTAVFGSIWVQMGPDPSFNMKCALMDRTGPVSGAAAAQVSHVTDGDGRFMAKTNKTRR